MTFAWLKELVPGTFLLKVTKSNGWTSIEIEDPAGMLRVLYVSSATMARLRAGGITPDVLVALRDDPNLAWLMDAYT